jgi:hypothetical protein
MDNKNKENLKVFLYIEEKTKSFLSERLKNLEYKTIEHLKDIEILKYECFSLSNNTNLNLNFIGTNKFENEDIGLDKEKEIDLSNKKKIIK